MIPKLILSFITGLVAHQTKPLIDRHISGAWNFLARVALGDLAKLPGMIAIYKDLKNENELDRLTLAYLLNSGTFGAGVLVGYIADAVRGA